MLNLNETLSIKGIFTLKVIDALTGEVLNEVSGENLILDSGIDLMCRALAGDNVVPVTEEEKKLYFFNSPIANIVQYVQLGNNLLPSTPESNSPYNSGALNEDPSSGYNASEIFKLTPLFQKKNTVTFRCVVPNSAANGSSGSAVYQEAVLMSKVSATPTYKWFARKLFPLQTKTSSVIFEINWDIVFNVTSTS